MVNSAGREISARDIGEDHVLQDVGIIPTLVEVINAISPENLKWLGGLPRNRRVFSMNSMARVDEETPDETCDSEFSESCVATPDGNIVTEEYEHD